MLYNILSALRFMPNLIKFGQMSFIDANESKSCLRIT